MDLNFSIFLSVLLLKVVITNSDSDENHATHRLLGLLPTSWVPLNFQYVPWVPFFPIYTPLLDYVVMWFEHTMDKFQPEYKQYKPEPYKGACGMPAYRQDLFRIIKKDDGEASPHSWPWQAYFEYSDGKKPMYEHMCGGGLIRVREGDTKSDIVVTAAHCVSDKMEGSFVPLDPRRLKVVFGMYNREKMYEYGRRTRRAEEILPRTDYDPITESNDIALVKLTKPVDFSMRIRPICLPQQQPDVDVPVNDKGKPMFYDPETLQKYDPELTEETNCAIAGWGRTNILKKGSFSTLLRQLAMKVREPKVCRDGISHILPGWGRAYVPDKMICASVESSFQGTCNGDGGGPLACRINMRWTMSGVLSFQRKGRTCLQLGKPTVYTRVSKYVTWIKKNAESMTSVNETADDAAVRSFVW